MNDEIILAKSTKDPHCPLFEQTLRGHTTKVIESFKTLFGSKDSPTRFALHWLRFFGLTDSDFNEFYINTLVSCCLHDIGKSNNGFQDLVRHKGEQNIRHEHLSAMIIWLDDVRRILQKIPLVNIYFVFSAVAGHHLKIQPDNFAEPIGDVRYFRILSEGTDDIFKLLSETTGISEICPPQIEPLWSFDGDYGFSVPDHKEIIRREIYNYNRKNLKKDFRLLMLQKAVLTALIISDSAGSGLVREGLEPYLWLHNAFNDTVLLDGSDIEDKIIQPRIRSIEKTGRPFVWSDFQDAAAKLPDRALLISPCGSGKTLAAWRWIKSRTGEKPVKRVIFLYPTRATATEGFRDYVAWAPESDGALLHGTADYELQDMFANPADNRNDRNFTVEDRLFAIAYWNRRIFSATVDQFLGFMQWSYRSVCLIPLLADSVIVIDEIHSFDSFLFSAFKKFLQSFNVPVLCLTASLPPVRKQALLDECNLKIFPDNIQEFSDLQSIAEMPRYKINICESDRQAEHIATEAFKNGLKVLWVVNTVAQCQQVAKKFKALCYHSRFKLEDRKNRHREVISAFQNRKGAVLAVTTQVCEMSLDLDADVLITQKAPITSLIQRMGRCNRHAKPGSGKNGKVYIYPPESNLPYSDGDLAGVDEFLSLLSGKEASQALLEELLEKFGHTAAEVPKYSAFLESGLWAQSGEELRDINDFSVQAILDSDVGQYLDLIGKKKPVDGLILSVPKKFGTKNDSVGKFIYTASSANYHPEYGFLDHQMEENR
ncbi:MAG: CRISPR-associated helicase Cas3' [Firmicutes bacterium]|nr:CRISPR-associated helicase Cas3' [Bacillota bacterium]